MLEALEKGDALGERASSCKRWRQIRHTRRYNNAKEGAKKVQARHRRYVARRIYLKTKAVILAQSARRAVSRKRVAALRRNRAASRVAAAWRGRKERRAYVYKDERASPNGQRRRAPLLYTRRWPPRPGSRQAREPPRGHGG